LVGAGRPLAVVIVANNKDFNETMKNIALQRKHLYTFCWIADNSIANSLTYRYNRHESTTDS